MHRWNQFLNLFFTPFLRLGLALSFLCTYLFIWTLVTQVQRRVALVEVKVHLFQAFLQLFWFRVLPFSVPLVEQAMRVRLIWLPQREVIFFIQLVSFLPLLEYSLYFILLLLSFQELSEVQSNYLLYFQAFSPLWDSCCFPLGWVVLILGVLPFSLLIVVIKFLLPSQHKNIPIRDRVDHNHSAHIRRVLNYHP